MKTRHVLAAAALSAAVPWAASSPLDPGAAVPALRYESAFAGYRPFDDAPRADWREVNRVVDEAARDAAGGHAGHRPASAPSEPAATTPTAPPAGSGHHGHGAVHGGAR